MYKLIKSEKSPFQHTLPKITPSHRQAIVHQFQKLDAARTAGKIHNSKVDSRHHIMNITGFIDESHIYLSLRSYTNED